MAEVRRWEVFSANAEVAGKGPAFRKLEAGLVVSDARKAAPRQWTGRLTDGL